MTDALHVLALVGPPAVFVVLMLMFAYYASEGYMR